MKIFHTFLLCLPLISASGTATEADTSSLLRGVRQTESCTAYASNCEQGNPNSCCPGLVCSDDGRPGWYSTCRGDGTIPKGNGCSESYECIDGNGSVFCIDNKCMEGHLDNGSVCNTAKQCNSGHCDKAYCNGGMNIGDNCESNLDCKSLICKSVFDTDGGHPGYEMECVES